MDIEEKRKIFLEKFLEVVEGRKKKFIKEFQLFNKFSGSGIKRKILRLIFAPRVYIPYILWKRGLCKDKIKETGLFWGGRIYIRTNDVDSFALMNTGILYSDPEIKLTKFFIKNLKENDIFYDVGANYGFYTYLALEFCKEVHSFEPLPYVFECLEMTLKNTPNVFLNNLALSDKEGKVKMATHIFGSCGSTIVEDRIKKFNRNAIKTIKVKTSTLDNYIASGKSKPTVIKLDAEGAESLIIDGGIEFFKNNNPIIAMEVWSKEEGYDISKKAVDKLKNLGYKPYFINFDGEIEKAEGELITMIRNPSENFIFKKNENSN